MSLSFEQHLKLLRKIVADELNPKGDWRWLINDQARPDGSYPIILKSGNPMPTTKELKETYERYYGSGNVQVVMQAYDSKTGKYTPSIYGIYVKGDLLDKMFD